MEAYPKLKIVAVFWRDAYHDVAGNDVSIEVATHSLTVGWILSDYTDERGIKYLRVMTEIDEVGKGDSTGNVVYIPKTLVQHIITLGEINTIEETFTWKRKG